MAGIQGVRMARPNRKGAPFEWLPAWNTAGIHNYELERLRATHGFLVELWNKGFGRAEMLHASIGTLLKISGSQGWLLGTTARLEGAVQQTNETEIEACLYNTLQELEKTLGTLLATINSPLPRRQGGQN